MVIMFEGSLHLNIYDIIKNAPTSVLLAVVGFFINMAAITLILEGFAGVGYLQNWTLTNSILLGSILGGISSLVVLPLIKTAKLNNKISNILTLESSLTDVLAVVITIAIIQFVLIPGNGVQGIVKGVIANFSTGAMLGLLIGMIWLYVLEFFKNKERLYRPNYMLTFACLLLLYAFTEFVEGSGAIAALAFGLVLGNALQLQKMLRLEQKIRLNSRVVEFNSQVSFFVKTFFFALIGLLLFIETGTLLVSIAVVAAVTLARPVAVWIGTIRETIPKKDKAIVNGLIPRGLAAAVLAILPASYGLPGTEAFSGIVFTVIIASIGITMVLFYMRTKKI